jgi:hypothetical protein
MQSSHDTRHMPTRIGSRIIPRRPLGGTAIIAVAVALCSLRMTTQAIACEEGWTPFGSSQAASVYTVQQYDGQAYRGGWFLLTRWNGTHWVEFGGGIGGDLVNLYAAAMVVLEEPPGRDFAPELVIGGHFPEAGDQIVNHITIWDGEEFRPVGGGMNGSVEALAIYDGDLIAGGRFGVAGGVAARNIARWDGEQWHPLAGGVYDVVPGSTEGVEDMVVWQGDLYVVGDFTHADGQPVNYIARWDGESWSGVGGGIELVGYEITGLRGVTVWNDQLIIVGAFDFAGDTAAVNVAAWDGQTWTALGAGGDPYDEVFGFRQALTAIAPYSGLLYAGGDFSDTVGPEGQAIAVWDGSTWSAVDGGVHGGFFFFPVVSEMKPFFEQGEESLFIGGDFDVAGELAVDSTVRWTTCPELPGDVNGDGVVDTVDLLALLAAWGDCPDPPEECPADFDGDDTVGTADLLLLLANWS